jgi:dethiobiotin synthetase
VLGTINHTLLSIEALKRRAIPILGVAFIGDENADSERTIITFGAVRRLGRLPRIDNLSADTLQAAFSENFAVADVLDIGAVGP